MSRTAVRGHKVVVGDVVFVNLFSKSLKLMARHLEAMFSN